MGRKDRSTGNWRYKTIKRYRTRAKKFQDEAITPEEYLAWSKVVTWFESILAHRYLNRHGAISLPPVSEEIDADAHELAEEDITE